MDTITTISWLPLVLQTADPLFPTGSYAHSLGAEEMARLGVLRDEKSLLNYLLQHTLPALYRQELPYLRFAMEAAGDVRLLAELQAEIDAWKLAEETRAASLQIGTRRLHALANLFPENEPPTSAHHLIAFARQSVVAEVPLQAALAAWSYLAFSGVCAAALKLIRIGQDGIQRALYSACLQIDQAVALSLLVERDDAGCFDPLLEIASMRHQRAEERLFIS